MSSATPAGFAPSAPNPHLPVRPEWLARHTEAALEPDRVIIDAHQIGRAHV